MGAVGMSTAQCEVCAVAASMATEMDLEEAANSEKKVTLQSLGTTRCGQVAGKNPVGEF